jgi:hypothetical protein
MNFKEQKKEAQRGRWIPMGTALPDLQKVSSPFKVEQIKE